MLTVNTNIAAINAQKNLSMTQSRLEANFGRLSSGQRINRASDDAAGLAISERLKSQIRSITQAERNANDATSLLQVAEGAMGEISGILTRLRELAVQAANDTLGSSERSFLDTERDNLIQEIDRIAQVTEFNGTQLLAGGTDGTELTFQVGVDGGDNDTIPATILGSASEDLGLDALDFTSGDGAREALALLDSSIDSVSSARADLGAVQNRLAVTVANLATARENLSAANSRIRDVDVASESAELTRNNILMQSGVAVLSQANQIPQIALKLLQ